MHAVSYCPEKERANPRPHERGGKGLGGKGGAQPNATERKGKTGPSGGQGGGEKLGLKIFVRQREKKKRGFILLNGKGGTRVRHCTHREGREEKRSMVAFLSREREEKRG